MCSFGAHFPLFLPVFLLDLSQCDKLEILVTNGNGPPWELSLRASADGAVGYTARLRIMRGAKAHKETKIFDRKQAA
jgi:hypothetical protein